jgi:hypothetical protein
MPKTKRQAAPKTPTEKKGKGGRPTKFDGLDLEKVKSLVAQGKTDAQMAKFFGVNVDTWHEWKKVHPSFSDALKDWKVEADVKVEASLYDRARGYSHPEEKIFCNAAGEVTRVETVKHYPPDPTSMIFWLKNRQPEKWRDRQDIDVTSGGNPFTLVSAIPEPAKPPKEE